MTISDASPPSTEGDQPFVTASRGPRILVVGCGAIGGITAAHLLEQGHDISVLTSNALIAQAVNTHGIRVRGEGSPGTVRGHALRSLNSKVQPFKYIILATQPPQVEEAARDALPYLAPGGSMVCFQNGLCEERIAAIAGADRVIGAVVAWGGSMLEPGIYERTSPGGFVLGRATGPKRDSDEAVEELGRILECIGPVTVSKNLAGSRWSKLGINCAISSLGAVGGDRLGVLIRHRFIRRLVLEIMSEVVAVAKASGIALEKVSGTLDLDWIALNESERHSAGSPGLFAKHTLLLAVGARFRRMRSSMLSAIERGRTPAVEFLNGEVISRGEKLGIPTPINSALRQQVLDIAAGKAKPSLETIRRFFEGTRSLVSPEGFQAQREAAKEKAKQISANAATEKVPEQVPGKVKDNSYIELTERAEHRPFLGGPVAAPEAGAAPILPTLSDMQHPSGTIAEEPASQALQTPEPSKAGENARKA